MIGSLRTFVISATAAAFLTASVLPSMACTRVVFLGDDGTVITGRSMDWKEDMFSNMWMFPRGIARTGKSGPDSIAWTSKYGSVAVAGYELGTADGLNEKGLAGNLLYLAESDYGLGTRPGKPYLSISLWMQYALDNFATVAEAVEALEKEPFQILAPKLPNGAESTLHLSLSDATGDSAIFQYVGGKLVIHHGRQYQVMTNSPTFDQQIAINTYWAGIGGLTFLPGTNRAADRFVRASFLIKSVPTSTSDAYIKAVPNQSFVNQAVASTMGVVRSVSVPLGITTPNEPNISSTIWRTAIDHRNKVYFFDSATSPNTFWVRLDDLDFSDGQPERRLTMMGGQVYSGNVAKLFEPMKDGLQFMGGEPPAP
ncbi:linear amide C-N hydrolase [Aestuariivirga sp.]|uniref:linear amide C-N hydrolase n=1 Tax=Aestuariivirga sp. TaxID=2650926 RepID=UPI0035935625